MKVVWQLSLSSVCLTYGGDESSAAAAGSTPARSPLLHVAPNSVSPFPVLVSVVLSQQTTCFSPLLCSDVGGMRPTPGEVTVLWLR